MKTGTPPRIDGRSLDYSKMEEQVGDHCNNKFSFSDETKPLKHQLPCYITYTNENVHEVLRSGFEKSPMFQGRIQGRGPRYCPSIEDKITRFSERSRHQLFVEPEGRNTVEVYLNGFSTSLPENIQYQALRLIPGFEFAKIFRPGYAIEYDYFPPTQLCLTLETKLINNLFFAGQINGTTGYEEAACQGIIAGMNAHLKVNEKEGFVLSRHDAYIGVLIDDLVTKGTEEPYRMFTSRAEYRLLLRQDNADVRLSPKSHQLGLASKERLIKVEKKTEDCRKLIDYFKKTSAAPEEINAYLGSLNSSAISQKMRYINLLSRPDVSISGIATACTDIANIIETINEDHVEQAEILMKYEGYLIREQENADKLKRLEELKIRPDFDYSTIASLGTEAIEKLKKFKPSSIGQASRISGINPSDISVLLVHMGR
jgi:tRNA uridine 5-carboxymethylaminomethyl modification enzyme